jgi:hypothetical protein
MKNAKQIVIRSIGLFLATFFGALRLELSAVTGCLAHLWALEQPLRLS